MNSPNEDENFYNAVRSRAIVPVDDSIELSAHSGHLLAIKYRIPYSRVNEIDPTIRPQSLHQTYWIAEMLIERFAKNLNQLTGIPLNAIKPAITVQSAKCSGVSALQFTIRFTSKKLFESSAIDGVLMINPLMTALEIIHNDAKLSGLLDTPFEPVKRIDTLGEWLEKNSGIGLSE